MSIVQLPHWDPVGSWRPGAWLIVGQVVRGFDGGIIRGYSGADPAESAVESEIHDASVKLIGIVTVVEKTDGLEN